MKGGESKSDHTPQRGHRPRASHTRTTFASTDVEIVVVVVAVVVDGEMILNSSAASFTAVVVASDKIGVRSTSTSTDVEIDIVVVVDGDNCRRLRRLFHHQLRSF